MAVEVDVTGFLGEEAEQVFKEPSNLAAVISTVVQAFRQVGNYSENAPHASSAIDLVIRDLRGAQLVVRDADRIRRDSLENEVRAFYTSQGSTEGVSSTNATLSLTFSDVVHFAAGSGPADSALAHIALGAPRRTAVVVRDQDGLERLRVRTTAMLSMTCDGDPADVAFTAAFLDQLSSILNSVGGDHR